MSNLKKMLQFLNKLEERKIYYQLNKIRGESILIEVSVPGQRWEIEYMDDGTVEIEIFYGDGKIFNNEKLNTLFDNYSD
jgi:hypothetical protein